MKAAQADNRILAVGSALSDRIQPRNSTTPEAAEMEISVAEVTAGHTHLRIAAVGLTRLLSLSPVCIFVLYI